MIECGRCGRYFAESCYSESALDLLRVHLLNDQDVVHAVLNAIVAMERALDGPVDPTLGTTAQIGLCTHADARTLGTSVIDRGAELLLPLPPHQSVLMGCRVLARVHLLMPLREI